ncbi:helix-turn-helix domain-containing protein [Streptomyces liliifuscus]|uniref:Helix-turn-helix domain-containing protein n=1 Tax=Streptomyces liliifuscus TaxID=2797636 RepID=A0A7T7KYF9_9ACTN|nr:helix-turn-helix transcriptional regulator [Streptomyces liliifuscus]QQM42814.1 helix-turn-helix domain-containing protein [Streptomyces liliifuscus]
MPHPTRLDTGGIGARIEEVSALRGYSLRELARRAHVSPSMLSRIINGHRQASPAIVSAVARALSVSISVLHGQPYIHQLQADQLDRLITPISVALDDWDIPLGQGDPPPRPLATLEATVTALNGQRARAEYIEIAHEIPSLLAEVNAHVLTQSPGYALERAAWLQAELCRTVYVVGRQIGFLDLARLALARMAVAAPGSGDPRQVAIERWDRAQLMADAARHDRGVLLVQQALRDLDDDGEQATRAVRGALHLKAAILSSRRGDTAGADEWLGEAEEIAKRTGETRDYGLVFGPVNVVIHAMSASSDRDKHARALEKARKVQLPEDYPEARAGHYWVDRARAETWTARHEDAFASLGRARKAAPQQTRYHPGVHETVATLLRARAKASGDLLEFANWCGV